MKGNASILDKIAATWNEDATERLELAHILF
jgi:hypothetical protein